MCLQRKYSELHVELYHNTSFQIRYFGISSKISDLWMRGNEVQNGIVTADTRVVFRSSSSQVFVYIQISSEMVQIDPQGDVYFEKCVKGIYSILRRLITFTIGFLADLFRRWSLENCAHFVSIIFCSRFYFIDEPDDETKQKLGHMSCDHRGRWFQDFYRLLVQNEHYEDWSNVLTKIKSAFVQYEENIRTHLNSVFV